MVYLCILMIDKTSSYKQDTEVICNVRVQKLSFFAKEYKLIWCVYRTDIYYYQKMQQLIETQTNNVQIHFIIMKSRNG